MHGLETQVKMGNPIVTPARIQKISITPNQQKAAMASIYQGMDLELPYPENWKLMEEREGEWTSGVTFETPGAAFLTIQRQSNEVKADEVLQTACDAMFEEYDEVEQEDLDFDVGEDESFGCDLHFYYLDLLICCRLLAFTIGNYSYLVQLQAEDKEFQQLRLVLQGMLGTAFQSKVDGLQITDFPG